MKTAAPLTFALAVLGAVPAVAASRPVMARWFDPLHLVGSFSASAMEESSALLSSFSVPLSWTGPSEPGLVVRGEIPVVFVRHRPGTWKGGRPVMGATQAQDSGAAVWVYPETVAASMSLPSSVLQWSPRERSEFGRALGRVIAHEIVHAILQTDEHARTGLMAAILTQAALRGPTIVLDAVTQRELARALGVQTTEADPLASETAPPPSAH